MKKYFISMFAFISFFFFCSSLNAKTFDVVISDGSVNAPLPTSYDTDVFNYFEEKKNNTEFYNFLNDSGSDILYTLQSLLNQDISVSNQNDYEYSIHLFKTQELIDYCENINSLENFCGSIDLNSNYSILLRKYSSFYDVTLNIIDNSLFYYDNRLGVYNAPGIGSFYDTFFFFDDSQYLTSYTSSFTTSYSNVLQSNNRFIYNFLSSYKFSYNWVKSGWWIFGQDTYSGTDFSYFLSKFYYSSEEYSFLSSISDKPTINVENYVFDNIGYDVENFSSIYGLDYYKKNSLISSSKSNLSFISSYYYDEKNDILPSGYTPIYVNNYDSVLLVPKIISDSNNANYLLYFNTNNRLLDFTLYSTLSDLTSSDFVYKFSLTSNELKSMKLPFSYTGNESLLIKCDNRKYQSLIFYNSSYYDLYTFLDDNEMSVILSSGTNIMSLDDFKLLYDTYYYTYGIGSADLDNLQDAIYIGTGTYKDYVSEYENDTDVNLNLISILSGAWDGAKIFIQAGYKIVELSTTLFSLLPNEVGSIIICAFTIGVVILIFKLFH